MTARRVTFPVGLDLLLDGWTADQFDFLLLDPTWDPNESSETYIADVSAYELVDASYSRQTAGSKTRTPTAPAAAGGEGTVRFDCANPSWTTISGGENVGWCVLAAIVTNDSDSPLVTAQPISYTTSGLTLTVAVSAYGIWQVSTVCPAQF